MYEWPTIRPKAHARGNLRIRFETPFPLEAGAAPDTLNVSGGNGDGADKGQTYGFRGGPSGGTGGSAAANGTVAAAGSTVLTLLTTVADPKHTVPPWQSWETVGAEARLSGGAAIIFAT